MKKSKQFGSDYHMVVTNGQARRQDLAARGGQKPGGVTKQKGGAHF